MGWFFRPLIAEWMRVLAEYYYIFNDSNYVLKQYEKNRIVLSIIVSY